MTDIPARVGDAPRPRPGRRPSVGLVAAALAVLLGIAGLLADLAIVRLDPRVRASGRTVG